MGTTASTNVSSFITRIKKLKLWPILMNLVFWGWNGLFGLTCVSAILPFILIPLLVMTFTNPSVVLWEILTFSFLLVFEVFAAIGIGIWFLRKRSDPDSSQKRNLPVFLFKFFYGIEAPLFILTLYRLFLVREMTPAMLLLLGTVFVSIGLYTLYLFNPKPVTTKKRAIAETIYSIFPVLTALYISLLILFFSIPALYNFAIGFFNFQWVEIFLQATVFAFFFSLLSLLFFFVTTSLFILMPFAVVAIYLKYSFTRVKQTFKTSGPIPVIIVTIVTVGITGWLWSHVNSQPQVKVFTILDSNMTTRDGQQTLLKNESMIRKGLLNAYLAKYRYISSIGSNNAISEMYKPILGSNKGSQYVQNLFNFIAAPFLYDGQSMDDDIKKAENYYESFFDTPIQKRESNAINRAISMTWDQGEIKAGLLNIENKKVFLKTQKVSLEQHGPVSKTVIYEHYTNSASNQEDVFYSFSLPDNAVVSGIWLGETSDTLKRHSFSVSPRGAAQQVYNSQLFERRDPALVELVGPNQYRLRAFPVPAYDFTKKKDGELHLWFEIHSLADTSGVFPLPRLIEKRNVYWNSKTNRFYPKGVPVSSDDWLPPIIKSSAPDKIQPFTCTINDSITLTYSTVTQNFDSEPLLTGNTAVIVDVSRSMDQNKATIDTAVERLQSAALSQNVQLSFFSACDTTMAVQLHENPISKNLFFFGQTTLSKICSHISTLPDYSKFTSIIILTDDGGYEMTSDTDNVPSIPIPVFIANTSKFPASAYPDNLVEMIQSSNGGFAENIDELFTRLRSVNYTKTHPEFITCAGNYVVTKDQNVSLPSNAEAAPFTAKFFINYYSHFSAMNQLNNLDLVHSIAKKYPVVTLYSSMIVLVNDTQEKLLADAESSDDRFKREIESGKENLSSPVDALKTYTTPEPKEWLGILTISILILFIIHIRKQKLKKV